MGTLSGNCFFNIYSLKNNELLIKLIFTKKSDIISTLSFNIERNLIQDSQQAITDLNSLQPNNDISEVGFFLFVNNKTSIEINEISTPENSLLVKIRYNYSVNDDFNPFSKICIEVSLSFINLDNTFTYSFLDSNIINNKNIDLGDLIRKNLDEV